jgi:O-acetyl-ADP-ribose deacetylase (regulator of RNase III)
MRRLARAGVEQTGETGDRADVKLTLVDIDPRVVDAMTRAFSGHPEVAVVQGDLVALAENTVVSPANSYGFMDGGIDEAYAAAIPDVERVVRNAIARRPEGHLPVGAAVLVAVSHARIEYVIAAPTMLMPERVESDNAYRAMRAMLRVAAAAPTQVRSVYCPSLCTGVGAVPPPMAAAAMAEAYADWRATLRV